MNTNILRGLFLLAFACIGLVISPSIASAQDNHRYQGEFSQGPEAFFGLVHLVPGLPLTRDEYRQLRDGDPVIYSSFRTDELREEARDHGWGSEQVRDYIDDKLSKEGNTFTMLTRMGGMIVRITRWKGVDMDSNCTVAEGFIIADRSTGEAQFSHRACNGNWQGTFSTAMASAIGQTATNVVSMGTDRVLGEVFGPDCSRGGCGPQFIVQGGTSVANSASESDSTVASNIAAMFATGNCGSESCPRNQNSHGSRYNSPVGIVPDNGTTQ